MNQDKKVAQQYLQRQIQNASAAEQVVMMYDGAIKFLLKAKHCIENDDIQGRFNNSKRAGDIIAYMLDILDMEKGGEISQRLSRIYGHLMQQQMELNMKNDPAIADEMIAHLKTLRESWLKIAKGEGGAPVQNANTASNQTVGR